MNATTLNLHAAYLDKVMPSPTHSSWLMHKLENCCHPTSHTGKEKFWNTIRLVTIIAYAVFAVLAVVLTGFLAMEYMVVPLIASTLLMGLFSDYVIAPMSKQKEAEGDLAKAEKAIATLAQAANFTKDAQDSLEIAEDLPIRDPAALAHALYWATQAARATLNRVSAERVLREADSANHHQAVITFQEASHSFAQHKLASAFMLHLALTAQPSLQTLETACPKIQTLMERLYKQETPISNANVFVQTGDNQVLTFKEMLDLKPLEISHRLFGTPKEAAAEKDAV